ncbi:MAG: D-2-hydroxyacid dehydrogenase [Lentisphaerae bacterium]|nr:MAG: D-2-hydroxyacid dehydrogenase [Lentisphaerota bacterium]
MKIVILDGYTANPGDLSWQPIAELGDLRVYDRTEPDQVVARAEDAQLVLTNKVVIDDSIMARLPSLRYIGVLATGINVIDCEAASRRGICVTNIPAYSTHSVAQTVFALLLALTNRVAEHSQAVRSGDWCASPDFCFMLTPLTELAGKTMGIIGFGAIGQQVARIALAFGMKVLVHTRTPREGWSEVAFVDLENVLRQSDVLSLHCPLVPATERIIDRDHLALMKSSAILINTGRGGLIDEEALAEALDNDRLAGAGLDVLSSEPPHPDNPLLTAKNCVITPHIAWATREARARLIRVAADNIRAFLAGNPVNVVH